MIKYTSIFYLKLLIYVCVCKLITLKRTWFDDRGQTFHSQDLGSILCVEGHLFFIALRNRSHIESVKQKNALFNKTVSYLSPCSSMG